MTPDFKRYRDLAVVAILLAVPFFFLRANMRKPEELSATDKALLRISAPIEFGAASLARGVSNVVSDYFYLVDVKADNTRLSYENARLREQSHRNEQHQVENQQLRRLLKLKAETKTELVSAQVIGRDFTEFFRITRVMLDRSSNDVRKHMPVIAPDGVVGAVMDVAGDSINVQLAVDAAFGVDVEDERTQTRGFVRGTGDPSRYACRVEMVDSRDDVMVGDLLVTSGKGKWFPKGISVARVTKVTKREPGRDQEVEAVPTVDFSRLDAVLIATSPPNEEPSRPGKP
jgi:rod shape-determining protein MreC